MAEGVSIRPYLIRYKRAGDGGRGAGLSLAEAAGEGMDGHEAAMFVAGSVSSAVMSYLAIRFLLRFQANYSFRVFACYSFALAAVVAVVLLSSGS